MYSYTHAFYFQDSPLPSIVPNTHEIPPVSSVSLGDSAGSSEPAFSSRSRLRKRVTPASEEEVPAPEKPLGKSAPNPPPSETPAPDPEIQVSRTSQEPEAQVPRRKVNALSITYCLKTDFHKPLVRRARTVAPTSASKSQALDENSQDASSATKSPSSGKPPSQSSVSQVTVDQEDISNIFNIGDGGSLCATQKTCSRWRTSASDCCQS